MQNDIVNIKGTRQGLVIFLSQGYDFDQLQASLHSKMESSKGFFNGAKFIIHHDAGLSGDEIKKLENICSEHGLIPDKDINLPFGIKYPAVESAASETAAAETAASAAAAVPKISAEEPWFPSALPSIGIFDEDKTACLRIDKNIRSGQKVFFDGHVIIDGDANPGSEITATGDIIIMGSLRGTAHAGANGSTDSVIVAYRMNPVQVRISSFVSRAPDNNQAVLYPEIARLQDNKIIIEPYSTFGLRRYKL